jgi:hypothetical protein
MPHILNLNPKKRAPFPQVVQRPAGVAPKMVSRALMSTSAAHSRSTIWPVSVECCDVQSRCPILVPGVQQFRLGRQHCLRRRQISRCNRSEEISLAG